MGAWGAGIFSNDTAEDVREDYRELVGNGLNGSAASETLIEEYSEDLEDPDVAPDFWLSLAATQWKVGRLEEGVKGRALELIDSGADLRRWEELGGSPGDLSERSRALARLRAQLTSPQRTQVHIRTPPREMSPFEQGDLFSYRLTSGPTVLFRVIELLADRGGTTPVIGLLDWTGESPPREEATLSALPLKRRRSHGEEDSATYLAIGGDSKRYPRDRIEILVRGLPEIEGGRGRLVRRRSVGRGRRGRRAGASGVRRPNRRSSLPPLRARGGDTR